jgi:hypothetical protein
LHNFSLSPQVRIKSRTWEKCEGDSYDCHLLAIHSSQPPAFVPLLGLHPMANIRVTDHL